MQHDVNIIIMFTKIDHPICSKRGNNYFSNWLCTKLCILSHVYFINCKLAVQVRCTLLCEFYKEQLFYTRNVQSCVAHCAISGICRYVDILINTGTLMQILYAVLYNYNVGRCSRRCI